jgi:hypothetical protein
LVLGFFRQYDYGFLKNLITYGNTKPPEYNFAVITSTVSLIVGPNDWLASPEVSGPFRTLLLIPIFVTKAVILSRWEIIVIHVSLIVASVRLQAMELRKLRKLKSLFYDYSLCAFISDSLQNILIPQCLTWEI